MPEFKDCVDCGEGFELTDGEVAFYKTKGMVLPKRCKSCREAKKRKRLAEDTNM